jgi:hypothetical protein
MIRAAVVTISFCVVTDVALGQSLQASPRPSPQMQSLTNALAGKWSTTYAFTPATPTALRVNISETAARRKLESRARWD